MKVILQQDVKGQGKKGQMVEVSDGYGRNFLLPRKLAVEATAENVNTMRMQDKAKQARLAEEKAQAQALAGRLKGVQVQIRARAGQGGKLFGSITSKEIAEELKRQFEIDVNKSKIVLSDPIKSFGSFEVKCKLGSEVSGVINVLVIEDKYEARSAREQAAKTRSGADGFSAQRAGKRRAQPQWRRRRRGGRAA